MPPLATICAECSQFGEWWANEEGNGGQLYFAQQSRIRVSDEEFYRNVPNRGVWQYDVGTDRVVLTSDDNGKLGKVSLTRTGLRQQSNNPLIIPYQISGSIRYNNRAMGFQ